MAGPLVEGARKIQERLKGSLRLLPLPLERIRSVGAVDVSYLGTRDTVFATVVLFSYPDLVPVEKRARAGVTDFPYIPGYLAFREVPIILDTLAGVEITPDVLLVDGHGIAHPRGFGVASHLGVVSGIPTIGVAKKKLVGTFDPPPDEKGKWTPLRVNGEVAGAVLRTRPGVKPVFVSPGHLTDLESSVKLVISVTGKYRIPEPLRQAHNLTVLCRAEWKRTGRLPL